MKDGTLFKLRLFRSNKATMWLKTGDRLDGRIEVTDYTTKGGPGKGHIVLENGRNCDFLEIEEVGHYDIES